MVKQMQVEKQITCFTWSFKCMCFSKKRAIVPATKQKCAGKFTDSDFKKKFSSQLPGFRNHPRFAYDRHCNDVC